MKNYIVLLLVLIFSICFPLSTVAEEPQFTIKAEETTALQGDRVAIKFSIENNPGISLFTLCIDYDKTKLVLEDIHGNSLMGGSFINNLDEDLVLWMSSGGDSTFNGTVFTAIFEVIDSAAIGQTEISVLMPNSDSNILNYNGDNIEAQIYSGSVHIQGKVNYGDVNSDSHINASDLVALGRILINSSTIDDETKNICDVNADNMINLLDLVRLKKYVSGINVTLGPVSAET